MLEPTTQSRIKTSDCSWKLWTSVLTHLVGLKEGDSRRTIKFSMVTETQLRQLQNQTHSPRYSLLHGKSTESWICISWRKAVEMAGEGANLNSRRPLHPSQWSANHAKHRELAQRSVACSREASPLLPHREVSKSESSLDLRRHPFLPVLQDALSHCEKCLLHLWDDVFRPLSCRQYQVFLCKQVHWNLFSKDLHALA